ncbi:Rhodopsin GPCR transmembrane domain [Fasciola hepatica]|uniref:Rhodopsin GPCR transmembrane domain n=1 Tax=Fasciola hepatica TaxID=6192 RepID=A0A4E0RQ24_FASHE|nr:Rhodopsin GPCR transmembrane domain [Fasciola hepatica]
MKASGLVLVHSYWYLSLVACVRNPITCQWETTRVTRYGHQSDVLGRDLAYSIWLVNGAPKLQSYNKFEHQFSFETHDTLEIFLFILVLYLLLNIIAHIKLHKHCSVHSHMLLASLWLSCVGLLLTTTHLSVFSFDGQGLGRLSEFGTFSTQWADAVFLALLLSTAEVGFLPGSSAADRQVTKSECCWRLPGSRDYAYHAVASGCEQTQSQPTNNHKTNTNRLAQPWSFLIGIIALFLFLQTALYAWAAIDRDPVIDFSIWNTVPGCLLLAVRFAVAFWFLAILRRRKLSLDTTNQDIDEAGDVLLGPGIDFIHFAAFFLLWMLILPLVVFIAETSVSSLWRRKTIISVCSSSNFIAACVYTCLLIRCCQVNQVPF